MSLTMTGIFAPMAKKPCTGLHVPMAKSGVVIAIAFIAYNAGLLDHLIYTKAEIAKMNANTAMLAQVHTFNVACPDPHMAAADQQRWAAYAAGKGWTPYPAGGVGCVDP